MLIAKFLLVLLAVQAESQRERSKFNTESSVSSNYSPRKIHSYYLPKDPAAKPGQNYENYTQLEQRTSDSTVVPGQDSPNKRTDVRVVYQQAVTLASREDRVNATNLRSLYSQTDTKQNDKLLQTSMAPVRNVVQSNKLMFEKIDNPVGGQENADSNNSLRFYELNFYQNTGDLRVDPEFEHLPKTDPAFESFPEIDPEFEHLPSTQESYAPNGDWEYDFPTQKDKRGKATGTLVQTLDNLNTNLQRSEMSGSVHEDIPDLTNEEVIDDYYFDSYDVDDEPVSLSTRESSSNKSDVTNASTNKGSSLSYRDDQGILVTVQEDSAFRNDTSLSETIHLAEYERDVDVLNDSMAEYVDEYEEYDYALGNDLIHNSLRNLFLDTVGDRFRSLVFNPVASPHDKFQECATPRNETGHCRYVQHCFLPNIIASLGNFMSYVCIIQERFIGICCPEFPVHTLEVKWQLPASELRADVVENITQPEGGCGVSSKTRIVGGAKADPKEWPWMAALLSKINGQFFCGGSLINSKYVLTAAHCTFSVPRNQILVRLGEYDFTDSNDGPGEDYPVVEIKRHAQYSRKTLRNDIALLKLARSATFGPFVATICLPESNARYVGQMATLAGWGNIRGGGPTSKVLLETSFPVWSNSECSRAQGITIRKVFICAGARTKDSGACNGDSGGPLMLLDEVTKRWKTIGVVSWGRRGCDTKFPTVFSRVSNYLRWIKVHSRD